MRPRNLVHQLAVVGAFFFTLTGCDSLVGLAPVGSVILSADSVTLLQGSTYQLTAVVTNEEGAILQRRGVVWASSDVSVVVVDSTGLLRAVGPGAAQVMATADAKSDTTAVRVTVPFQVVAAGGDHSCGLGEDGALYCWGARAFGEESVRPKRLPGNLAFERLTTSGHHTCGLDPEGRAYCWGPNQWGQLGDGTRSDAQSPVPVAGQLTFRSISAGWWHTCGVSSEGRAYCWGYNQQGQLGNASAAVQCLDRQGVASRCSAAPVPVAGGLAFSSISAGVEHTCGVTTTGAAYCWGLNGEGRLGRDSVAISPVPARVMGDENFLSVSAGYAHTCALSSTGAAYCWGSNSAGQLGNDSISHSGTPLRTHGGLSFTSLDAGSWHTCGISTLGSVYCWGENGAGQLGSGTAGESSPSTSPLSYSSAPVAVADGLTFLSVTAGYGHSCGVTVQGLAYCWGNNAQGQLGNSSPAARPQSRRPVLVSG